ncbi:hypothetical protein [Paraburkholderia strydomiana]
MTIETMMKLRVKLFICRLVGPQTDVRAEATADRFGSVSGDRVGQ